MPEQILLQRITAINGRYQRKKELTHLVEYGCTYTCIFAVTIISSPSRLCWLWGYWMLLWWRRNSHHLTLRWWDRKFWRDCYLGCSNDSWGDWNVLIWWFIHINNLLPPEDVWMSLWFHGQIFQYVCELLDIFRNLNFTLLSSIRNLNGPSSYAYKLLDYI